MPKERWTPATVLVFGTNHMRVNTMVSALHGENILAIGATSLWGIRTALLEFPSLRVLVFLYNEDYLSPLESVVLPIGSGVIRNFYTLANFIGWECARQESGNSFEERTLSSGGEVQ